MQTRLNILVTGGAGYIGSHVVQLLCEQRHHVTVFDNLSLGRKENVDPRASLIVGDILNKNDLKKAFVEKTDVIFHFAAWKAAGESMTDPAKYAVNNICGTINLFSAMLEHDAQYFVFSSSAAVYGDPQYLPVDEQHPKNPANYYGYTKLAIEQNLEWYSRLKGIKYAALRYFNATGYDVNGVIRGQEKNPANLCPVVMEAACGMRPNLQVFGNDYPTPDGTGVRDYIHVSDLADAHLLAMQHIILKRENLVVNLGTGKGQSVLEMIAAAERATGKSIKYEIVDRRPGDPPELMASCDLALRELGWKAKYSDLDTIFRTMKPVYFKDR